MFITFIIATTSSISSSGYEPSQRPSSKPAALSRARSRQFRIRSRSRSSIDNSLELFDNPIEAPRRFMNASPAGILELVEAKNRLRPLRFESSAIDLSSRVPIPRPRASGRTRMLNSTMCRLASPAITVVLPSPKARSPDWFQAAQKSGSIEGGIARSLRAWSSTDSGGSLGMRSASTTFFSSLKARHSASVAVNGSKGIIRTSSRFISFSTNSLAASPPPTWLPRLPRSAHHRRSLPLLSRIAPQALPAALPDGP